MGAVRDRTARVRRGGGCPSRARRLQPYAASVLGEVACRLAPVENTKQPTATRQKKPGAFDPGHQKIRCRTALDDELMTVAKSYSDTQRVGDSGRDSRLRAGAQQATRTRRAWNDWCFDRSMRRRCDCSRPSRRRRLVACTPCDSEGDEISCEARLVGEARRVHRGRDVTPERLGPEVVEGRGVLDPAVYLEGRRVR